MKLPGTQSDRRASLISNRRLAKSAIWGILGNVAPLVIGLVAVPLLIKGMGTERFGVLTIIWVAVGYFSVFDFGLARALAKRVADLLGAEQDDRIPEVVGTGFAALSVLGVLGSVVVWFVAPWLAMKLFSVSDELQVETIWAIKWMAISLPFVFLSTGQIGVLQAFQEFRPIALIRLTLGAFMFLGPLVVLPFSDSLVWFTGVLLIGRVITWAVLLSACNKRVPELLAHLRPNAQHAKELLTFGGWLTVSNIVAPMMAYFDRFFVGSLLGMSAVAYYATPHDVLTKAGIIVSSYMAVLFPAISTATMMQGKNIERLVRTGIWFVGVTMSPVLAVAILLAPEALTAWLGLEFARESTAAVEILAGAVFINSFAKIPYTLVQASGRADWSAKVHLAELPAYLALLWWLTINWGIKGAALAWCARVGIDTVLFFGLAVRLQPGLKAEFARLLAIVFSTAAALYAVALLAHELLWIRLLLATAVIVVCTYMASTHLWLFVAGERSAERSSR